MVANVNFIGTRRYEECPERLQAVIDYLDFANFDVEINAEVRCEKISSHKRIPVIIINEDVSIKVDDDDNYIVRIFGDLYTYDSVEDMFDDIEESIKVFY